MRSEKGFSLIEMLIAVAIIGIIVVGIFSSLGIASKLLINTDTAEAARDLAEAQMEYIQNQPFSSLYSASLGLDAKYPGYSTEVAAPVYLQDDLQKINITIQKGTDIAFILVDYKVKW